MTGYTGIPTPKFHRRLVFLRIILFHPKQLIDRVYRILHDAFHFGLCYARVFWFSHTSGALSSGMNIFDGPVAERQCYEALGLPGQREI